MARLEAIAEWLQQLASVRAGGKPLEATIVDVGHGSGRCWSGRSASGPPAEFRSPRAVGLPRTG